MTVFFTSDTHFGHERIITLSDRPFKDVTDMNEALVRNWNAVVGPDDHVYHLGDVALGGIEHSMAYLSRLNGRKTLVTGNHDRIFHDPEHGNREKHERYRTRFRPLYQQHFQHVVEGTVDEDGNPTGAAELLLLPGIEVNLTTKVNSASSVLRMSHFPYTGDSHDKPRFDQIRPVDDGKTLVHGHTHQHDVVSRSAKGTLQIHVGVDSWDYRPVSIDEITALIAANQ